MSIQLSDSSKDQHKTESEPIINVQNLVKRYGSLVAVNDVSFSIKEGEIFGMIGPNGAGKTTTVECISGLRRPDSGSISVYGFSPQKERNKIREFVGVQLQESSLPQRIKVREVVNLFASFYPDSLDVDSLLTSLGIKNVENSIFKQLSGGQKQRVSIALALVGMPRIAILDELTTGLDPEARRQIWNLIDDMRKRGVTVILVTHFMDEAERLCDRLALIDHGAVKILDTPEAIVALAARKRVHFILSKPLDDKTLSSIPGVIQIERKEKYITVIGTGDLAMTVINYLAKIGVSVSDLEARGGTLDDAFVNLISEDTLGVSSVSNQ